MQQENGYKLNYSLYPIAWFYGIGVWFRNLLFNKELLKSEQYPIPVICIGNISVGGTGKTPHTEYLINLLKDRFKVAVLSRGYKRKTKGFLLANTESSSKTIGDEPYQIKLKFPEIMVAVDENRRRGIAKLLELPEEQKPDVILLDDGFQHRYVQPSLSLVLTDYNRLFYDDKLLPVGLLRESKRSILRADAVVVTKCDPELRPIDYRIMEENMNLWAHQQVYFTRIVYGEVLPVFPEESVPLNKDAIQKDQPVAALAGIAKPELFIQEIERYSGNVRPFLFGDHHNYNKKDIRKLNDAIFKTEDDPTIIITTEKDAARLKDNKNLPDTWKKKLYYLPISVEFCSKGYAPFDNMILDHVSNFKKIRI